MDFADDGLNDPASYAQAHDIAEAALSAAAAFARPSIPDYLSRHYWWAYISPKAVTFFERPWLVNLILLGNYNRLAKVAADAIETEAGSRILQIACAYGELTPSLARKVEAAKGELHVIDVLPIQLSNLSRKLGQDTPVQLSCMDSCNLKFHDEKFDSILLFFLMHEQPDDVRRQTLLEAWRVLRKGGKLLIVDYSLPCAWNPFRYLMRLVLRKLEPFALDLWVKDAGSWLPQSLRTKVMARRTFFAGMYQMLEIEKR
mgnify:FL=1